MIDPKEFNLVSQISHTIFGILVVIAYTFFLGTRGLPYVCGAYLVFTAIKEFWYDENYETPEVRGSNLEDFLFYNLGMVVGIVAVLLKGAGH